MRIDAFILKNFVKKASLCGASRAINLNFKEEGLHSSVRETGNVAMADVFMSKDVFTDYKALGEIFIKDSVAFINYLGTFGSYVDITMEGEYIMVLEDESRVGSVLLGAEIVCDNVHRTGIPELDGQVSMMLTKNDLERTFGDIKMLKVNKVTVTREEEKLIFEVGTRGETDYFQNVLTAPAVKEKHSVSVGDMFKALYETMDESIELKIATDKPLIAVEKGKYMTYTCTIAPFTS